ncbi:MAG: deoxyribodipyrimidine photo-lyase, partial [Chloroflexi bacterium]|nr:deoxyribodipyrimidine photo-lyase [Chloroflexota bacterium]
MGWRLPTGGSAAIVQPPPAPFHLDGWRQHLPRPVDRRHGARRAKGGPRGPAVHRLPGGGTRPLAPHGSGPGAVTAIWWIRRDLRLADNPALAAALAAGDQVVPAFVLDPVLLNSSYNSPRRTAFLLAGLRSLDTELHARGSRLIVRGGDPEHVLASLRAETGASSIFAQRDVSPYAIQRDQRVQRTLPLVLTDGLSVRPPGEVVRQDGGAYTVFTPFSRAWLARPLPGPRDLLPAPARILTPSLASLPIPEATVDHASFPAGEPQALRRLEAFCARRPFPIGRYALDRDRPSIDGTSGLSPYLRFGMLSARQAVVAALRAADAASSKEARHGAEVWLNELIWREFYLSILAAFPDVRRRAFRADLGRVRWSNDRADFQAWCEGRTGYPMVDAGMRQLSATGWMHNRVRMIVASFLVKHLLIDWRWGERWFMQNLVDGDPAANNGGWQWSAGTGTDAAPYFRVFNPVLQGR